VLVLQNFKLGSMEAQLEIVANSVSPGEQRQFIELLPHAASSARTAARHWDFLAPGSEIDRMLERAFPNFPKDKIRLRKIAVARLALDHFEIPDSVPDCVLSLYPDFLRRLTKSVSETGAKAYEDEYFAKDVRYALGLTLPGGALQFDLECRIGPKLIVRDLAQTWRFRPAYLYLRSHGWGRWYNEHIDLRAMREFNPEGWTAHCILMAAVLRANPGCLGIMGAGWFYDPALAQISPGLAYIHETQTRHGAFLVRIGTAPHHIENALHKSATRRRLYEEGKYMPTCYLCAWPRAALLAWARRAESDPSVGFAAVAELRQPLIRVGKVLSAINISVATTKDASIG